MTCPLIRTPPYSMKIFAVTTFANCPKTAKFAKVFTRKRFSLYGICSSDSRKAYETSGRNFNKFKTRFQ